MSSDYVHDDSECEDSENEKEEINEEYEATRFDRFFSIESLAYNRELETLKRSIKFLETFNEDDQRGILSAHAQLKHHVFAGSSEDKYAKYYRYICGYLFGTEEFDDCLSTFRRKLNVGATEFDDYVVGMRMNTVGTFVNGDKDLEDRDKQAKRYAEVNYAIHKWKNRGVWEEFEQVSKGICFKVTAFSKNALNKLKHISETVNGKDNKNSAPAPIVKNLTYQTIEEQYSEDVMIEYLPLYLRYYHEGKKTSKKPALELQLETDEDLTKRTYIGYVRMNGQKHPTKDLRTGILWENIKYEEYKRNVKDISDQKLKLKGVTQVLGNNSGVINSTNTSTKIKNVSVNVGDKQPEPYESSESSESSESCDVSEFKPKIYLVFKIENGKEVDIETDVVVKSFATRREAAKFIAEEGPRLKIRWKGEYSLEIEKVKPMVKSGKSWN